MRNKDMLIIELTGFDSTGMGSASVPRFVAAVTGSSLVEQGMNKVKTKKGHPHVG